MNELIKKIRSKNAIVGIVGVGYVGEALGLALAEAGFTITGFDVNEERIKRMNARLPENFRVVSDKSSLRNCDVVCICVPTPLTLEGKPDYSILETAAREVAANLKKGQLVITESSVSPGTTRNRIRPILESSGYIAENDFYLGYSPERVDPGNNQYKVKNIPKVVSGIGEKSLKVTREFYGQFVTETVPVSTCDAAELTKVLENVFRLLNISLINEVADFARAGNINIWEVIHAASTKPFGFMAHYPGPGAGGYCIPVLPEFLLEAARNLGVSLPLVDTAAKSNKTQPLKVANMALNLLNGPAPENGIKKDTGNGKENGHRHQALIVGIGYKEEVGDTRESVALKIWDKLEDEGVEVHYHDPYVERQNGSASVNLNERFLSKMDVIIVATPHKKISYDALLSSNKPLLDTRNALKNYRKENIYKL